MCHARHPAARRRRARIHGFEVDFDWPDARLVVEADGRRHHDTTAAFERDRARDAVLLAAGLRVARYTHRRLTRERGTAARELLAMLTPRR